MARTAVMWGDLCPNCMTYGHPAPPCSHNPEAPCPTCREPVGYRWTGQTQDVCWYCETGRTRPQEPMRVPREEWAVPFLDDEA